MVLAAIAAVYAGAHFTGGPSARAREAGALPPTIVPAFVYQGNPTCAGSNCHSAGEATEQSGQMIGDEYDLWTEQDPHQHAFKSLKNDLSKSIAAKMSLGDPAKAGRCLDCHAVDAPTPQRGEQFALAGGVGCEACHGPAEKYLEPHAEAGWTIAQRGELGSAGLLSKFGLIDTTDLSVRTRGCVACHLEIGRDMIDAGHPPLEFEMYAYNYYISKKPDAEFAPHWDEPVGRGNDARLWATGQAAALTAATRQLKAWKAHGWKTDEAESLEALYAAGVEVAKTHFGGGDDAAFAKATYDASKCAAAATDLAGRADVAGNAIERRVLAFGVTALGSAAFDAQEQDPVDAFWDAYDAALEAAEQGGDAYVAALAQLARIANEATK